MVNKTRQVELENGLLKVYQKNFVASSRTDLVIEGYPRSANSYCVECVKRASSACGRAIDVAHHTHDIRNVELGMLLECPVLVLVRDPVDAIASYALYMDISLKQAAGQYVSFYDRLLALKPYYVVVDFSLVVSDFNKVIEGLSEYVPNGLRLFDQPEMEKREVIDIMRSRAIAHHGEAAYVYKSGAPHAKRSPESVVMRAKVDEYLAKDREAKHIYEAVLGNSPRIV